MPKPQFVRCDCGRTTVKKINPLVALFMSEDHSPSPGICKGPARSYNKTAAQINKLKHK